MDQFSAPLAQALFEQAKADYVPFDVPGHKGRAAYLTEYFGELCVSLDKNSRKSIDYLCQPRGVILQAEQLAAEAFGAANAFFMVGGTTASVQAMVMCACAPGEKIILPRNVHYSVINAIILAGAVPVYINPCVHAQIGISLGMSLADVEACIAKNRDARAIIVNNPTYYGVCSDLAGIVRLAHQHGMMVLVDEAHGTHFYFGDGLPVSAMQCGADMAAVSMHKTGGSFTQSAILLTGHGISRDHVTNILNLTRTTSASYLLLASLDLARRYLATCGREVLAKQLEMTAKARQSINAIGGYVAFGRDIVDGDSVFDFDCTKLSVNTLHVGLAGIEVYSLLRDRYGIQLEFGDAANVLALSAMGDEPSDYERLVQALADIREKYGKQQPMRFTYEYVSPTVVVLPRDAFYAKKKSMPLAKSEGMICGEAVMCYPPGIPLLAPGERITAEILEHILYASEKGCTVTGLSVENEVIVLAQKRGQNILSSFFV